MQARKKNRLPCRRPLIAALATLSSCGAWADEPTPWYVGVSESVTHDSNVYRITGGPSDTYTSSGLLGGFDQSIGRQHFSATANLRYNKYNEQDTLNNTSYGLNAGWDWTTIQNFSGNVSVQANQALASFDGNATLPTTSRNILKTDQIATSVRWGGTGILSARADYAHSRVRYSAPEYLSSKSSADTGSLGADYNVGPTLRLGTAVRFTRSVSPYGIQTSPGVYESNSTNGRNLDLSADWHYTVQTNASARLSWTHQTNSGAGGQDFSGLTGSLSANYAPTGKLAFSVSFNRDAGTNGSFFNIAGAPGSTATNTALYQNSQVTNTLSLGTTYAATAKISANANYQYRQAKIVNSLEGSGFSTGAGDYTDTLHSSSLGLTYDIARAWQLSCNLSHENRSTSSAGAFSYTANVVGCAGTFTLR